MTQKGELKMTIKTIVKELNEVSSDEVTDALLKHGKVLVMSPEAKKILEKSRNYQETTLLEDVQNNCAEWSDDQTKYESEYPIEHGDEQ